MNPLVAAALKIAIGQLGVRESPMGSNRGPEVDEYLRAAGLNPDGRHFPWCASFVVWCFREAAKMLGVTSPVPRVGGALMLLQLAPWARVTTPAAGCVFVIDHGGGKGHAGFVERVAGNEITTLYTVEGNEDNAVRGRTRAPREILGYLDFSRPAS